MKYSMIILAGGRSSRMGRDKSELMLGEDTFLEAQIRKGRMLGIQDILVSGYRGQRCPAPVVRDRLEGKGPLGGLESCLRRIAHEKALVLGVDTPLVPAGELEKLLREAEKNGKEITILSHGGKEEPLIGVYGRGLADAMAEEVERRKGSVFAFIRRMGYGVYESGGGEEWFFNINRPEDYAHILERHLLSK